MERYRLGVDIGGTFTDFLLMNEATGDYAIAKVASTPAHPSAAILTGLARLEAEQGLAAAQIAAFVHGTTLAVNTLIQRSGARTGLLVTEGYRDILELRRLRLADPSQLYSDKPAALASRRDVREIRERLLADGSEYLPLDLDQVEAAARELVERGVQALAVAFLHSYANPAHELAAKAHIEQALPGLYVCTSSEIWPQFREYERTLVAVMNAHIGQRMADYFTALDGELRDAGLATPIFSTKSNGGIMTARHAAAVPVETLLSGPASGVIGAAYIARQIGEPAVITFDMGGTSADVSVISGDVSYSTESHVGEFPVVMPVVDVSSIGAGGGSIAWIDREGVLKVGPRSVGASPGPACYGRGGADATVTDAYVELGILDPHHFLGGELVLQPELARAALGRIGERLGCGPAEAARHVLAVATANMYAEFVPLMGRRGIDAREFSLLAYGGAGPTHAFMLAREVGIARVVVPPTPGVLCALGCLIADFRADFIKTLYAASGDLAAGQLEALYQQVEEQALGWLREQHMDLGGTGERVHTAFARSADMRYHGQSFEITVPAPSPLADAPGVPDLLDAFHEQYARIYGTSDREAPAEVISIRVQVIGQTPKPAAVGRAAQPNGASDVPRPAPEPMDLRVVRLEETTREVPVYARSALEPGMAITGPCIIEQYDSTVFVTPEFDVRVDPHLNVIGIRVR